MFAGGFEGRAKRAFNAEGSSITQIVPEVRDALEIDASDSTVLRERDIAAQALEEAVKQGKKTAA